MSFGFTPKFSAEIALENLTPDQFLVIAHESMTKLNWQVNYISSNGLKAYTNKGIFSLNAEIQIIIQDSIAKITSSSTGNEMVDWGKNKKNVDSFLTLFQKTKEIVSHENISEKIITLRNQFVPPNEDILILPPETKSEKIKTFFFIFVPKNGFSITPILLDLNILIFAIMTISGINILVPGGESLLKWGANFRPSTLEGQWWRLLTCCFLHIGIFHLLMNMYALLYIGSLLEPILGKSRFAAAYLFTGLAASTTSLLWHPLTISAGASGAIFGLYGVFLALLTTNYIEKTLRKALLTSIAVFVGYNLLYGMKAGIDNAAHVGGLISGLIIGYSFLPSLREDEEQELKYRTIIFLIVPIVLFIIITFKTLPNDFSKYAKLMEEFTKTETRALQIHNVPPNSPKERLLYEIKNRGIYYWNENIKILQEAQKLKLPQQIRDRNARLLEYCELRIKSLELTYKAIEQESPTYQIQIDNYNKQIENIIVELTNNNNGS